jgi:pimeloyl-ACP methyl ester carboxylesterase
MTIDLRLHRLGEPGGTGPLLLLAHGMEDSWESWRPLAERLVPSWQMVAVDLPWRAGNDYRWRRECSAGHWVQRALALLGDPVDVLVGHSFGATAVLEVLAAGMAPAAQAAVLAAPFVRPPELPVSWQVFERSRQAFDQIIRDGLRVRLGHRARALDEDVRESMVAKMIEKIGPIGFLTLFDQFVSSADFPLGPVTVPTLVLAGRADPVLTGERAAALGRLMPSATVRVREHYHHFCHVEQVEDMARQLVEFVGIELLAHDGRPLWKDGCT